MKKKPGILSLLKPYWGIVFLLILFTVLGNGINLWVPKIISAGIDSFTHGDFSFRHIITEFLIAITCVFVFTYLQTIVQVFASEKVARDLRTKLSDKISKQSYAFIEKANPSKLLTNLTADVDSIKTFISQAIASIISSLFIIIGASILLFTINWKLALCVIAIIPIIGITFFVVLKKVRALFIQSRAVIDWLNKVINESILGAAIIRVVNSQQSEYNKFLEANNKAKEFGLSILRLFAGLIPVISFTANIAGSDDISAGRAFCNKRKYDVGKFCGLPGLPFHAHFPDTHNRIYE